MNSAAWENAVLKAEPLHPKDKAEEEPDRTLTERWSVGPDGDWWQVEWPVKGLKDFLVKTYSQKQFETAVLEATRQAMADSRIILGIADRVSVNAEFARLQATTQLITDAGITYA